MEREPCPEVGLGPDVRALALRYLIRQHASTCFMWECTYEIQLSCTSDVWFVCCCLGSIQFYLVVLLLKKNREMSLLSCHFNYTS